MTHHQSNTRYDTLAVILLSCLLFFSILRSAGADELPPSGEKITEQFDKLWKERRFTEFEAYADELITRWPRYLPAIVADLIRQERRGAQYEKYLDGLRALQRELMPIPYIINPDFMEILQSQISLHERELKSYLDRGVSPEERLKKFAPPNVDTQYANAMGTLLTFTPSIMLPSTVGEPAHDFREDFTKNYNLSKYAVEELVEVMDDALAPQSFRLAAAEQFKKSKMDMALPALIEIIGNDITSYAGEYASMVVSDFGVEAVPLLVRVLHSKKTKGPIQNAAFALARIGVATPEVLDALNARMAGPYYSPYVESVVTYLENKSK